MMEEMFPEYPEARRRAFARSILRNSLRLRRGENLLVETWSETLPWAESMVLEARILGANPLLTLEDEATFWKSVDAAPASYVGRVGTHEWEALKWCQAQVHFAGPSDTGRAREIPAPIQARMGEVDEEWYRLIEKAGIRTVRWDLGRTNEATARRFGVDLSRWREELIDAATRDPAPMRRDGVRIARILQSGREVRITHRNGTDLTLRLAGRMPIVNDGIIDPSDVSRGHLVDILPSGVVAVTVEETVAEGTLNGAGCPGLAFITGYYNQVPLKGGRWQFHQGRLTDYSYEKGGAEFRRAYQKLGPGKDRPGLLSVGLNPAISSIPIMLDEIRGAITLSVGRDVMWGGRTQKPDFVVYQSLQGADLEVDGVAVTRKGRIAS
jgi:leucyl aminopeptidase (aminopeptidase T)